MRRVALVVFALLFARNAAKACEPMMYERDQILTNEPVFSSNGRYLAIERWYEKVKDFEGARADTIINFDSETDENAPPREPRKTMTFALYEANTRRRLSEFSIPFDDDGTVLVSDSGYVPIVRPLRSGCGGSVDAAHALVTIVRPDGVTVARLTVADVFTVNDVANMGYEFASANPSLEGEENTTLVLTIDERRRRIDLASAKLIDEKENLIPQPVVSVDAAARNRKYVNTAFDDASSVHLTPRELLALARDEPMPAFPEVARKAHVIGPVWVEVVVSEYGEVLAARATPLPFGLSDAALAAVRTWRFRPLQVEGKLVQYSGELAFHFERKVVP